MTTNIHIYVNESSEPCINYFSPRLKVFENRSAAHITDSPVPEVEEGGAMLGGDEPVEYPPGEGEE